MNPSILVAIRCSLMFLVPSVTYAISAQWDLGPISGDWNTAANWTPMGVPNGPADTATFGLSNTTDVSISANTEVNGITFTPLATNPYTITASAGLKLTISGVGIVNNSGTTQNFVTAVDAANNHGVILFKNSATAGNGTFFTNSGGLVSGGNGGGVTLFHDSSTAGSATIINNGGMVNFQPGGGSTEFANSSTAGSATITNNGGTVNGAFDGGFTRFLDTSSAGNGTFTNNAGTAQGAGAGFTAFYDSSSAGNGTFTNNASTSNVGFDAGSTQFWNTSTAGNGTFINNGSAGFVSDGGLTSFEAASTAANGTFTNNGGTGSGGSGGQTNFFETSTAANGTLTNNAGTVSGAAGGKTIFQDTSTAGSATLIANGGVAGADGGSIEFFGRSTGGTSRAEVFGNGNLDISAHAARGEMTIGSIEGDGNVFLGSKTLTVGSSDVDTTFSGVIQDGGIGGGTGGSLTKIGLGTLILSEANTYRGNTNIRGGVLQVDGSITSNTSVNAGGTLAGTGTVSRNVTDTGGGTVSPGHALGTLSINGNYRQTSFATLLINIAALSTGQFSVLDVNGFASLIGANAILDPVLLNGFVPTVGDSFAFLNYTSLNGTFFMSDANIDNLNAHWEVTYGPSSAILTVAPGNVPIVPLPDQGSTFLLLTVGLLGLMTFRRPLLRGQP
jgi:hypothetical protein